MASRRDQLQSYQFLTQRVISAFVMRETDPAQSPLRRGIGAVFAGLMIAVMVGAGFGVYGLLTKIGSNNWKTNGAIVVEKETGATYVYNGGQLHPMLNFTSALLDTMTNRGNVFRESSAALVGVPRGVMLGIPDAPDSLPDAGHTVRAPWTLCTAANPAAQGATTTTLALSVAPAGARPLGDQSLLVRDPDTRSTYLIWHGNRYQIDSDVLPALFGIVTPITGGTAWLNGLPRGTDIDPIGIAHTGSPSSAAAGHHIGDLLVTQVGTGGVQYWLVFDDGLAPITELQKDIVVGQGGAQPQQISVSDSTKLPRSTHLRPDSDAVAPPTRPPTLATLTNPTDQICAEFGNAKQPPAVSVGGTLPVSGTGTPTGSRTASGTVLADRVIVPAGHVEVVAVMASSTTAAGGYYVVTDLGIRYAVSSDAVLKVLGYQATNGVAMPNSLVRLIPLGPALDPAAAQAPVPNHNTDGS
ncbi:type VII secretion protein EccB [Rugosimonospora africana]|uniref:Type VII secretion protein EccB n=1 Tax=Rugosimonospora africana TaxID=556532 RepID=A0A8J3VW32_9ACTN|nr:type VII secretion protein EccB [Rugosimonospora africana]GIH21327.1 type VII secretion protein EccB [Rugosimonospora africana]